MAEMRKAAVRLILLATAALPLGACPGPLVGPAALIR